MSGGYKDASERVVMYGDGIDLWKKMDGGGEQGEEDVKKIKEECLTFGQ